MRVKIKRYFLKLLHMVGFHLEDYKVMRRLDFNEIKYMSKDEMEDVALDYGIFLDKRKSEENMIKDFKVGYDRWVDKQIKKL